MSNTSTRRNWFKALLGIAVAPVAAKVIVADQPFTYSQLHEAYMQCCFGPDEPDLIEVSPKLYARIIQMLRPMDRWMEEREGRLGLRFMQSVIVPDTDIKTDKFFRARFDGLEGAIYQEL